MLFKPISDNRLSALIELYTKSMSTFVTDKKATTEMVGSSSTATPETAALIVVANAMLNLDEWVNKN